MAHTRMQLYQLMKLNADIWSAIVVETPVARYFAIQHIAVVDSTQLEVHFDLNLWLVGHVSIAITSNTRKFIS